jgi:DNA-directed RNA polymerase subunit RPC12/RpoP
MKKTSLEGHAGGVKSPPVYTCSICQQERSGYSNNAWPANRGRSCDHCNKTVVIPKRIKRLHRYPTSLARVGTTSQSS